MDQPETGRLALDPLEIVHQGPVVVSLYWDTLLTQPGDLIQVVIYVFRPEGILTVAGPVFGNPYGSPVFFLKIFAKHIETFGVYLPIQVVAWSTGHDVIFEAFESNRAS